MRQFLSRDRRLDRPSRLASTLYSLWHRLKYLLSREYWASVRAKLVRLLGALRNTLLSRYHALRAAKARILIFAVPLVLAVLALVGGSTLVLRLFFLSLLVPVVSYLWALLSIRGVSARCDKPPEHCQVGEEFQQEVTVFNNSRIPKLWLEVKGDSDMPGECNAALLNLSPRASHSWQSAIRCEQRGGYSVGSVVAAATDPFGFFTLRRRLGEPHRIIVYPATFDLPLFKLSSPGDSGRGSSNQSVSLISPNASSVREFAAGDSLHHIHWRSTAHTGRFMVKVFDVDRSYGTAKSMWVVIDMEEAARLGEGRETTEEYAVTIAASLIRKHLESGMRVGMMASGGQVSYFPPERGEEHLERMMEALALMKATGQLPLGQVIHEQAEHLGHDSIVVVVTPSAAWQSVDAIRFLRNRVESVVAVLLDPSSFGGDGDAATATRSLSQAGVQVYTVRRGDELARALDNRLSMSQARYA